MRRNENIMEKQEQVVREFSTKISDLRTGSLTELAPRSGEKYRFAWRMEGVEGKTYYELFQMGACLYFTAETETFDDNDELKMLQLLNWLNGWSHYGIFTNAPRQKRVFYEQTHFCRFSEYSIEEVNDYCQQMIKRMSIYYLSADLVFKGGVDIEEAVDKARRIVRTLHTSEMIYEKISCIHPTVQ
jgi:hypothetical protein